MSEDVADRLDDLEDEVQSRLDKLDAQIEHVVKPRVEDLEDTSDDAREERAELGATLAEQQSQIAQLQSRVEILAGVDDESNTNPEKRVADLRDAMIDRADARGENGAYSRIKLWWRDVQDVCADRGHGEVKKPECYKAMEDAAEAPGFEMATKLNSNNRDVKAVAVDTEALRDEIGSSDPTTPSADVTTQSGGDLATSATQD